MIKDKKNFFIQILAFVGLALTIELALIYYNANYNKYALSSFCSVNNFVDCDGVAKTQYSQFLGIPLAYWGIFFYLTILFLTVVDKLKQVKFLKFLEVFKEPKAYITFLGVIAFACSMILAGISINIIKKICVLCVATYVIDFVIALMASWGKLSNIIYAFKTTFADFKDGAKKYTAAFIVLCVLSGGFLAYSGFTLNFVPNVKKYKSIVKYRKIKYNPFRVSGNNLGNPEGEVVIDLYSDYVCPLCYMNNIMLHQAAKEFSNIYVIHHNLPFDKACNKYINIDMHPKACFMSCGALAAKKQNKYWDISSLLYEKQPNQMSQMVSIAKQCNMDIDKFIKDIDSVEIKRELLKEIDKAESLGIDATPTIYVNGDKFVGVRPYYELKKILIEHGAKRR